MSKTVAVVSDSGFLTDALGTKRESDSRYSKFSKRLLGTDTTTATLDYGWNGASNLTISKNGEAGESITLNAATIIVPHDVTIGGVSLDTLIEESSIATIRCITGVSNETTVTVTEGTLDSSDSSGLTCTIGLSHVVLDRISTLEDTVEDLIKFENVYVIGDGLHIDSTRRNTLSVKLGHGLKFETDTSSSDAVDDNAAITFDMDDMPTEGSVNPVTSGGVYSAIRNYSTEYNVGIDATTGNMKLYHNT